MKKEKETSMEKWGRLGYNLGEIILELAKIVIPIAIILYIMMLIL